MKMNTNLSQKENYMSIIMPNKRKISMMVQETTSTTVDVVDKMKDMFTKRQQKYSALARQMRMGYPSVKDIVEGINKEEY